MGILNIYMDVTGQAGIVPQEIYIETNDTIATVTAAGYLNPAKQQGYTFSNQMIVHMYGSDFNNGGYGCLDFQIAVSPSTGIITLSLASGEGEVVLPVTANHLAVFTNTLGTIGDDAATAINGGNLQAGLSGTAGYLASFPGTAAKGSLRVVGANSAGDTVTQITNASQAAARTYTIPDGGQSASNFLLSDSAGTQTIATGSLALTLGNITAAAGSITATAGNIVAGSTGAAGSVTSFSGTGSAEFLRLAAIDNVGGNFSTTISNASSVGQSQVISIPDAGAATASFLLNTGSASTLTYQKMISLSDLVLAGTGTWTVTRLAQANYGLVHTPADDTSILAFDITPMLQAAANHGFRLNSIDVIYSIGTLALDAHSMTLDSITYVNNVANAVTSVPLTGSLATATQGSPYVTNLAVTTPAFMVTADTKYVMELTVNAAATSTYTLYGMNLRFSQTIA